MAELVAETRRLLIRHWKPEDRSEYRRRLNTPGVTRFVGGVQSDEEMDAAFERVTRYQLESGHTFWALERKSDGAFLGFCGLKVTGLARTPVEDDVEIGWRLREDAWGQGYAREAAETVLDWAWANLDRARVVAFTIPSNEPSWRLMERLGMKRRPDLDFAHPKFAIDHPLSRHICYVAERPAG
jgi:RimJ/RimL family protein N-acetyltransferase